MASRTNRSAPLAVQVTFTGLTGATSYDVSVAPVGGTAAAGTTVRTPAQQKVRSHAVQIRGKAKVRGTLTVNLHRDAWTSATTFRYQWLVGGKVVGTRAKLKLTPKLAGKKVTVRVTGTSGDRAPATVTSKAVRVTR